MSNDNEKKKTGSPTRYYRVLSSFKPDTLFQMYIPIHYVYD